MFLVFGVNNGSNTMNFRQNIVSCPCCGRYGALEVFKEYSYFSLFFVPVFYFNRHYYVHTTCCGSIGEIDKELGLKIAKGEVTEIDVNQLKFTHTRGNMNFKRCAGCGYETKENFDFCPRCGRKF
jgi:hypothetical protein